MPECQTLYSPKRGQYAGMSEKISHTRGVNCPEQGVNYSGTGGQLISEYTRSEERKEQGKGRRVDCLTFSFQQLSLLTFRCV